MHLFQLQEKIESYTNCSRVGLNLSNAKPEVDLNAEATFEIGCKIKRYASK